VKTAAVIVLGLGMFGCESSSPQAPQRAAELVSKAQPAEPRAAASERRFGAAPSLAGDPIDVERVLAAPQSYLNQTIKCSGTVARVCEAAGCWLELRAKGQAQGLRVPMAGHAFFVPQDVIGRPAVVEGVLAARELPAAELAHLRGEGLQATGPLFLAATSVVVH
jgi:hypothetical protein